MLGDETIDFWSGAAQPYRTQALIAGGDGGGVGVFVGQHSACRGGYLRAYLRKIRAGNHGVGAIDDQYRRYERVPAVGELRKMARIFQE